MSSEANKALIRQGIDDMVGEGEKVAEALALLEGRVDRRHLYLGPLLEQSCLAAV